MNKSVELQIIALQQGGLFTAKQAISCGYATNNHGYHVRAKHWNKERFRGIYSLPAITQDAQSSLWTLFLWSRDRNDKPQAVISHETALLFYDLSEVNPQKVHFTVPTSFQKWTKTPASLILHKANLPISDINDRGGLKVTSVLRTLIDVIKAKTLSFDIIESAVRDALDKGYLITKDIADNETIKRFAP